LESVALGAFADPCAPLAPGEGAWRPVSAMTPAKMPTSTATMTTVEMMARVDCADVADDVDGVGGSACGCEVGFSIIWATPGDS
jgi:hypothetical protein